MSSWRDDFLALNLDARRRIAELHCRGKKKCRLGEFPSLAGWDAIRHTRDELLDFGTRHRVMSPEQFRKAADTDTREEYPPTTKEVNLLFGNWRTYEARLAKSCGYWNWGGKHLGDIDLIQLVCRMKIRTQIEYRRVRANQTGQDLIPSINEIYVRFGSWKFFRMLCISYDVEYQLDRYFRESILAGHSLADAECDKRGIEIRYLREVMTPEVMDALLHEKETLFRKANPGSYLGRRGHKSAYQTLMPKKKRKKWKWKRGEEHEERSEDPSGT